MDIAGNLVFLVIMLLVINVGGIVRLKFFNNLSWGNLKKVLIVTNGIFVVFYIAYIIVQLQP